MLNAQKSKSGLDLDVPRNGRAADAYQVACTATWLDARGKSGRLADDDRRPHHRAQGAREAARHATALHMISGRLHRLAERQCNEDLTCRECGGEGAIPCCAEYGTGSGMHDAMTCGGKRRESTPCRACAGEGLTIGRTLARLERQATEIAAHYGCRAYFQGDPRGCALHLIPVEIVPDAATLAQKDVRGAVTPKAAEYLRSPEAWIESNYTRGHAVSRLGR